jgi:flagellar biosynthetic protein FlhB
MMKPYRLRLDLQLFSQEKTEKATPKKRQDARKKGLVAKSAELTGALILFMSFLGLIMFGSFFKERVTRLFTATYYNYLTMELSTANVMGLFGELTVQGLLLLAPLFAVAAVIGITGNFVQIGFLVSGEPLRPKLSKINPIEGFKRIFSLRSLVDFVKTVLKLLIIGVIAFFTLWGEKEQLIKLSRVPVEDLFTYAARLTGELGLKIGAGLVALAVLDYLYQKYEHEKNLRMSKQEIRDELKRNEGDPLIKGKIRERQRRMALSRMMQEVPKADVIITNPTHFAVALQYDGATMEAPKVIAKGQDYVALKIKEIAREHGIVTMENKPLARALYERTEIGDLIPADLFQAVAEVLAYVYQLKGRTK